MRLSMPGFGATGGNLTVFHQRYTTVGLQMRGTRNPILHRATSWAHQRCIAELLGVRFSPQFWVR